MLQTDHKIVLKNCFNNNTESKSPADVWIILVNSNNNHNNNNYTNYYYYYS